MNKIRIGVKVIVSQAAGHLGARVVSSLFSFALFALISRKLPDAKAQNAFFFLFAFGFWLATLRMFGQLSARIDGQSKASLRLKRAKSGLISVIHILPIGIAPLLFIIWYHTHDVIVVTCAMLIAPLASLDFDLLRSVVNRGPAFSTTYAAGTSMALIVIYFWPTIGLRNACLIFLLQWVPTAILNCKSLRYIFSIQFFRMKISYKITSMLLLASFDGVILNAPFLGLFSPNPQTGIDLSVSMRIFTASLPMLPLLMHWANSSFLINIANKFGMGLKAGFIVFLVITGIATGILFSISYVVISAKNISAQVYFIYFMLLLSYSVYVAQMRLVGPLLPTRVRIFTLSSIIFIFLILFAIFSQQLSACAIGVVLFQSLSLLICSAIFSLVSYLELNVD